MSKRGQGSFKESSSAKDYIRATVDRNFIKAFKDQYYPDEKLSYLGLPGEHLLDILSWREFIGQITAVEGIEDEDIKQDLELRIMINRLKVDLIYNNIDRILRSAEERSKLKWPYQIVNLDYCGGLIYKTDENISNRIEAIRGLMQQQEGSPFVLFLTLNLRDRDEGEMDNLMEDMEQGFEGLALANVSSCFKQHREQGHAGKLKVYVPVIMMSNFSKYQFLFNPPILYQGTKQMMHFAIQCLPYTGRAAGRLIYPDSYIEVINMPLWFSHEGGDLRQHDFVKITPAQS